MLALSDGGWAVLATAITVIVAPIVVGAWNSHQTKKAARETAAQMLPNGGASIRDAVDRIEESLAKNSRDFVDLCADVRQIELSMRADTRELRSDVRALRNDFDRIAGQYLQRFIDIEDRLILIEQQRPTPPEEAT